MSSASEKRTMGRFVKTHPMLFGSIIGLLIGAAIISIVVWFPSIGDAWDRHNGVVRSVWCTAALFVVCIIRLWRWRRRLAFWVSMSILLFLHVAGISFYSIRVQPPGLGEWIVLVILESFVIFFGVDWIVRRFGGGSSGHSRV
jgi:hypothetical protein